MQSRVTKAALSVEIREALREGRGVVALESTLVAHGLPWPTNLETALAMEDAVRAEGSVPATIALFQGTPRIGLSRRQLETVARHPGRYEKAGVRDLPFLVARKANAVTTVGSTIFLAHRAGVRVMATGGIGGVHRGAAETGDISADLVELSRTPVAVVCSGAKSILDLPRTVELLETLSVPVVGYRTDQFPAFYSRRSGIALDHRLEEPAQAAEIYRAARSLRLSAGLLVANPPPAEFSLDPQEVERWVADSLRQAGDAGVTGKAVTPFLLGRVRELSGGRSLLANRALAIANAGLAASIATALVSVAPL